MLSDFISGDKWVNEYQYLWTCLCCQISQASVTVHLRSLKNDTEDVWGGELVRTWIHPDLRVSEHCGKIRTFLRLFKTMLRDVINSADILGCARFIQTSIQPEIKTVPTAHTFYTRSNPRISRASEQHQLKLYSIITVRQEQDGQSELLQSDISASIRFKISLNLYNETGSFRFSWFQADVKIRWKD